MHEELGIWKEYSGGSVSTQLRWRQGASKSSRITAFIRSMGIYSLNEYLQKKYLKNKYQVKIFHSQKERSCCFWYDKEWNGDGIINRIPVWEWIIKAAQSQLQEIFLGVKLIWPL